MNKFEGTNPGQEYTTLNPKQETHPSQPDLENYQDVRPEQSPARDFLQKTPEELERVREIRQQIQERTDSTPPQKQHIPQNPAEVVLINGQQYHVEYVPKEDIYPAYGYGGGNSATVRQDLSPRVKRFVKAHELYHCQDKATWGGWLGQEIRANIIPGLKDPIGLAATSWKTITDIDRIKFYLRRIKEGR
ncbi:MAG: hypothetical protein WC518_01135 [Patescibacteria group bacterium]